MASNATANEYFSGQGVVLVGSRDAVTGLPTGLYPVGNVSELKLTIATTVIEHKESTTGQRGIDLRLTTETKGGISFTLENFDSTMLALASRGTETVVAAGTITDLAVKGYPGKVSTTGKVKFSALTVELAPSTALTAYVNDTTDWDYKVNLDAGSIYLNGDTATQAVLAGTTPVDLLLTGTYAAQTRVEGLVSAPQTLFMRFEGLNTASESGVFNPVVVEVFKFLVDPFKELSLIGNDVQSFVLEGSMLSDALRTSGSTYFNVQKL